MTRTLPPLLLAMAAAVGFAWIVTTFRCCEGEDGFARNVTTFSYFSLGLFLVTMLAFRTGAGRWVRGGLRVLTIWSIAIGIVLLARPAWDVFVSGGDLGLAWRTLAVFAATTLSSALIARLFNRC